MRELPTIPEFDYYNADDEDEEDHSGRYHNHFEAASETAAETALNLAAREAASTVHCSATAKLLARLSNTDLAFEWSMLCQDCTDCWSQHGKPNKCFRIISNTTAISDGKILVDLI